MYRPVGPGASLDGGAALDLAADLRLAEIRVAQLHLDRPKTLATDQHLAHVVAAFVGLRQLRGRTDARLDDLAAGVAFDANGAAAVSAARTTAATEQTRQKAHTPHSVSQSPMCTVSPTCTPARSSAAKTPSRSSCFWRWSVPSSLARSVMATSRSTRLPWTRYTPGAMPSTAKPTSAPFDSVYTRTSVSPSSTGGRLLS